MNYQLTDDQLTKLDELRQQLIHLRREIEVTQIPIPEDNGVDFLEAVKGLRGKTRNFDTMLFRIIEFVNFMWSTNHAAATPSTQPQPKQSIALDDIF